MPCGPRSRDLRAMLRTPRGDVVAGVTVGVVALPLALAFGIASGLGATAGLVTAVVAGIVAAVFGGSHVQVSGPTGAMTVVLVPIVAEHGASGVAVVALMAGGCSSSRWAWPGRDATCASSRCRSSRGSRSASPP